MKPNKKIDENYFKDIDDQHKAYLFGFLLADGCVYKGDRKSWSLSLCVNTVDEEVIQYFVEQTKSEHKVSDIVGSGFGKESKLKSICISNPFFTDHLVNKGFIPKKSLTLNFDLDIISENLKSHFLRGFFDGNGSISIQLKGTCVKIATTRMFANTIRNYLIKKLNIKCSVIYTGLICSVEISSASSYKFLNFIYENAIFSLKRKYLKYIEFKNKYEKIRRKYIIQQIDTNGVVIQEYKSALYASKIAGCSDDTILRYCKTNKPRNGYFWKHKQ